jgi:NAD(P)-dependent dehydrogenase (short-subunit alcohol dehydrogenase family)
MNQKTVVITGGNKGIGLSLTKSYVEAGYFVVVGARENTGLESQFGSQVQFVSIDVRVESDHYRLVDIAIKKTGVLDVYINNAGFSEWRPIVEVDEKFLNDLISTNLKGVFWGCKAASSAMLEGGCIVNISSIAGKRGSANNSVYCASKFGVNGLTQALAKELGPMGIRVNALCPVLVSTDGLLEALESPFSPAKGDPKEFIENFRKSNAALERLPSGVDVAALSQFLTSDSGAAMTGQCINVDCGVFPQ